MAFRGAITMKDVWEDWKLYERLIARLMADQLSTEFCVTPNASILGAITGIKRQIDVLIEARHDTDNSRRIIVDAKRRKRKNDVKDVERSEERRGGKEWGSKCRSRWWRKN